MKNATLTPSKENRIKSLNNYAVNPEVTEKQFDEFTALIANLCKVPKAIITIIDGDRLWLKSKLGLSKNFVEFKKSFCRLVVTENTLVEISNTETDLRLAGYESTNEFSDAKFYAGVPLITSEGTIGTLCIMDSEQRVLTEGQRETLVSLGEMVSSLMESRKSKTFVVNEPRRTGPPMMFSLRYVPQMKRSWS